MPRPPIAIAALSLSLLLSARADGLDDNRIENVRRIPPPGIPLADTDRAELRAAADGLGQEIVQLREMLKGKPAYETLLPDVEVFQKAVDWALRFDEFYASNQVAVARELLHEGRERAEALRKGAAPWTKVAGLIVRGYRSKIDDSVQPYGLVVPEAFVQAPAERRRLDFWFHGRGEKLTELDFINQRRKSAGEFTPPNAFVLHLYGRYCNANKFAGEVDLFEALEHAKKVYPVDDDRLVVRGFSMGGAACWQFATHFADRWAAAAPGAGFAETPEFLNVFQNEELEPTWWEQKLWHWYNATDYALNLLQCPTVAYSGEVDRQKQAADAMARSLSAEGGNLTHVIGKGMGHQYDQPSKAEINRRIDAIAARGRDPLPREVRFTTFTLRYPRMHWVALEGLEQHWERALVTARITGPSTIAITTTNVSHLLLDMPPGLCPLDPTRAPQVFIDGIELSGRPVMSDRSWQTRFRKVAGRWQTYELADDVMARKRAGLQGPIDDAFMDRFIIVRPTGTPMFESTGAWAKSELEHAVEHWRRHFRGELRVVNDTDVTVEELRSSNLILFGDAQSNQVLKQFYDVLPVTWREGKVVAGRQEFDASQHMLVAIGLNPLQPDHYVVLNSGFTFREYDQLNNARQVAKLPDWAVIDIRSPVTARAPGKIVAAGFFDEHWRLTPPTEAGR